MPLAGDPISAADINTRVGQFEGTADVVAAAYAAEAVIDTVTASVTSGRRYRVQAWFPYSGTVVGDRFLVRLRTGTTTAGTQIAYTSAEIHSITGTLPYYTELIWGEWISGTTGNVSFCTTVIRNNGTGNLSIKGATSQIRLLTVDLLNTV